VGIGTTSPAYKLEVNGGPISIVNGFSEPTSEDGYRLKFADNGGINNDSGIGLSGSLGDESLWINKGSANGNIRFLFGTLGERLRITSGGEVLIGSTTSLYTDTNRGVLEVNGASSAIVGLTIGGTNGGYLLHGGTDLSIWNAKNGAQIFGTNNSERLRITSGGNLLVGTTSDNGQKLQVNGDILCSVDLNLSRTGVSPAITLSQPQLRLVDNSTSTTVDLNIYSGGLRFSGSIQTGAPSGGTAKPFKIGAVATVSPTSPNRTIQIEIDGTTYYLSAKTTND
jgi:hypothetical protein